MNRPVDVFFLSVIDGPVDVAQSDQPLVARVGVREHTTVFPDSLPDDRFQDGLLRVRDEFKIDLPVSLEHSEDWLFPDFCTSPSLGQALETESPSCLFPEILEGSAVVALIHLHRAGKLPTVHMTFLDECVTDRPVRPVDDPIVGKVEDPLETTSGETHGKPIDELVPESERESFLFQKCSGLESELRPAVTTPIGRIMGLVDSVRLTVFTARDATKSRSQKYGPKFLVGDMGRKDGCKKHVLIIARYVVA